MNSNGEEKMVSESSSSFNKIPDAYQNGSVNEDKTSQVKILPCWENIACMNDTSNNQTESLKHSEIIKPGKSCDGKKDKVNKKLYDKSVSTTDSTETVAAKRGNGISHLGNTHKQSLYQMVNKKYNSENIDLFVSGNSKITKVEKAFSSANPCFFYKYHDHNSMLKEVRSGIDVLHLNSLLSDSSSFSMTLTESIIQNGEIQCLGKSIDGVVKQVADSLRQKIHQQKEIVQFSFMKFHIMAHEKSFQKFSRFSGYKYQSFKQINFLDRTINILHALTMSQYQLYSKSVCWSWMRRRKKKERRNFVNVIVVYKLIILTQLPQVLTEKEKMLRMLIAMVGQN